MRKLSINKSKRKSRKDDWGVDEKLRVDAAPLPLLSEWRQCKARGLGALYLDHFRVRKKPRQIGLKNANHQEHGPTLQKHIGLITRTVCQDKLNTTIGKKYYISNFKCWRIAASCLGNGWLQRGWAWIGDKRKKNPVYTWSTTPPRSYWLWTFQSCPCGNSG